MGVARPDQLAGAEHIGLTGPVVGRHFRLVRAVRVAGANDDACGIAQDAPAGRAAGSGAGSLSLRRVSATMNLIPGTGALPANFAM